jgi:hypothetical protein
MATLDDTALADESPAPLADAPVTPSDATPADDPIASSLAEYDAAVGTPEVSLEEDGGDNAGMADSDLSGFLEQLEAESAARHANDNLMVSDREQELSAALQESNRREFERVEKEAFAEYARDTISKLPAELLDREQFVQDKLLALSVTEPVVRAAFDLRNADLEKAAQQKQAAEHYYALVMQDKSNDPRKPAIIAALKERYQQAEIALNAKNILARAQQHIIDAGRKAARGQIDSLATEDRNAVAMAVKGASGHVPAGPPEDYSSMSTPEFEQAKRRLFKR